MKTENLVPPCVLKELLIYDPLTGKLTWLARDISWFSGPYAERTKTAWNNKNAGKEAFTAHDAYGYKQGSILGRRYLAHHVIFAWMVGYWPPIQIDHENGIPDDNRWVNIRHATRQQNQQNTALRSDNTSGYMGVRFIPSRGKWRARIARRHIGYFVSKSDAVAARAKAEKEHGYHPNHGREKKLTASVDK